MFRRVVSMLLILVFLFVSRVCVCFGVKKVCMMFMMNIIFVSRSKILGVLKKKKCSVLFKVFWCVRLVRCRIVLVKFVRCW